MSLHRTLCGRTRLLTNVLGLTRGKPLSYILRTDRDFHYPRSSVSKHRFNARFQQTARKYASESSSNDVLVKTENKVLSITLNRPKRYNALLLKTYDEIARILSEAAENDAVSIVKVTGAGKYFCSGNDLMQFLEIPPSDMKKVAEDASVILERYVSSYIEFPKPLIAAVNGPALGIAVTTLAHFDAVFASSEATFQTPFPKIGQSPEACSSYLFPKIMGHAKASKMLLFGEAVSATEAEQLSLVTKIFPASTFQSDVDTEIEKLLQVPLKSLIYTKRLIRDCERDLLHKVNKAECERLIERWTSEDCMNAMIKFYSK